MDYSPDYIQTITSVEDMPPIAANIVSMYCADHQLDEKDIHPSEWEDIMTELYLKLFKPCKRLLKTDSNLYNQYDIDKVIYIYNYIYKRLCNSHRKEIHLMGFCEMTGIERQTLYNWSGKANCESFDILKKIDADNEQSLFDIGLGAKYRNDYAFGKLNHRYGWNGPGMRADQDTSGRKPQLTQAEVLAIDQADGPEADF